MRVGKRAASARRISWHDLEVTRPFHGLWRLGPVLDRIARCHQTVVVEIHAWPDANALLGAEVERAAAQWHADVSRGRGVVRHQPHLAAASRMANAVLGCFRTAMPDVARITIGGSRAGSRLSALRVTSAWQVADLRRTVDERCRGLTWSAPVHDRPPFDRKCVEQFSHRECDRDGVVALGSSQKTAHHQNRDIIVANRKRHYAQALAATLTG